MQALKVVFKREAEEFEVGFGISINADAAKTDLSKILHQNEMERVAEFMHSSRKQSYRNGRLASKYAIAQLTDQDLFTIDIGVGIFAFPVVYGVEGMNLQVSLSHVTDTAVAFSFPEAHPLGIDLEEVKAENTDSLRSQLSKLEAEVVKEETDTDLIIHMMWSMKEALSKIIKTGLMISFDLLETYDFEKNENSFDASFRHHKQYKAKGFYIQNYVIAIVMPKNSICDFSELEDLLGLSLKRRH